MSYLNSGDVIYYTGDLSVMPPSILRNAGYATISTVETFNYGGTDDVERLYLRMLRRGDELWAGYDKVRTIQTTEVHLERAGFQRQTNNGRVTYIRGHLAISEIAIKIIIGQHTEFFMSGFCIADFSRIVIDLREYLKENREFDVAKFYSTFPSVNSVHLLLPYLNGVGLNIAPEVLLD